MLVVDDEASLVGLARSYLERESQPDLVVLDVMLPGLYVVEVCHQLRQFSGASAGTIVWTTTARLTRDGLIPCRRQYSV